MGRGGGGVAAKDSLVERGRRGAAGERRGGEEVGGGDGRGAAGYGSGCRVAGPYGPRAWRQNVEGDKGDTEAWRVRACAPRRQRDDATRRSPPR